MILFWLQTKMLILMKILITILPIKMTMKINCRLLYHKKFNYQQKNKNKKNKIFMISYWINSLKAN